MQPVITFRGLDHSDALEADIRFAYRALVDRGIRSGVEIEGEPAREPGGLLRFSNPALAPADVRPRLTWLSLDLETTPDASAIHAGALVGDGADEVHVVAARPVAGAVVHADERALVAALVARIRALDQDILAYDRRVDAQVRDSDLMRRIGQVCGVGPITASAIVASVGDAKLFKNGRQFAAWLGLVPRQYSTGGKALLGRITKRGDVYLRTLLVHGARSALITLSRRSDPLARWAAALVARRGFKCACVALAAKNARVIWALLAKGEPLRSEHLAAA